jgi:hypothetical protein
MSTSNYPVRLIQHQQTTQPLCPIYSAPAPSLTAERGSDLPMGELPAAELRGVKQVVRLPREWVELPSGQKCLGEETMGHRLAIELVKAFTR